MHELAVATRLVDRACETASEHGADRVTELSIELGAATHLRGDQVRFCVETVAEGTPAADAEVTIETVAPLGECDCGWSGKPDTVDTAMAGVPNLTCPACGSRLRLTAGNECRLVSIEVSEDAVEAPPEGSAE